MTEKLAAKYLGTDPDFYNKSGFAYYEKLIDKWIFHLPHDDFLSVAAEKDELEFSQVEAEVKPKEDTAPKKKPQPKKYKRLTNKKKIRQEQVIRKPFINLKLMFAALFLTSLPLSFLATVITLQHLVREAQANRSEPRPARIVVISEYPRLLAHGEDRGNYNVTGLIEKGVYKVEYPSQSFMARLCSVETGKCDRLRGSHHTIRTTGRYFVDVSRASQPFEIYLTEKIR